MRNAFFALGIVAALFALLMTCPGADAKFQDRMAGPVAANGDGGDFYFGGGGAVDFDGGGAPFPNGGDIFWGGGLIYHWG